MINQFLFTKPKGSQKAEPGRRLSAKAVARQFQKMRGPLSPQREPMEIDEDRLDHPVRVSRSSQSKIDRLDHPVRVSRSSQRAATDAREFSRERRDIARGKKPEGPSKLDEGSEGEEEELTEAKKQPKKIKQELSKEEYLTILLARGFAGTRYPHRETCRKLGIARDVEYLYRVSSLSTFMMHQLEAYREETCHFLSSLAVHFYEDESEYKSDGGPGFITFTCRGLLYSLTIRELDTLYGFASGTGTMQDIDNVELQALWSTIGDDKPYWSARTKSSQIRSPVVRYFHKAIANTMFARKVTGNVNEGELQMLDMALKEVLDCTRNGRELMGDRADTSLTFVLLGQLLCYKDWALRMHRMNSEGELSIGGIITPILVACGVELTSEPYYPRWIDIEYLRRAKFLDKSRPFDEYWYLFTHPTAGEAKLRLPCTEITKIRVGANMDFITPVEVLYNPLQEAPQPEDSDDSVGEDDEDASARFGFDEYHVQERSSPALKEAHKRIGLLQKWNKLQGKTIAALKGTVKELKEQMKDVRDQLKELQNKFSGPSSKKMVLPKRVLLRSGSLREEPRSSAAMEPPRASSYEPRQRLRQYSRKQKRRQTDSTNNSTPMIESVIESAHRPAYTRESMEESVTSFFSNP